MEVCDKVFRAEFETPSAGTQVGRSAQGQGSPGGAGRGRCRERRPSGLRLPHPEQGSGCLLSKFMDVEFSGCWLPWPSLPARPSPALRFALRILWHVAGDATTRFSACSGQRALWVHCAELVFPSDPSLCPGPSPPLSVPVSIPTCALQCFVSFSELF